MPDESGFPWKYYYNNIFESCWLTYDDSIHEHLISEPYNRKNINENMLLLFKKYIGEKRTFSYKHIVTPKCRI